MMSFIIPLIFSLTMVSFSKLNFWVVSSFLIVLTAYMFSLGLGFTDYMFLSGDTGLDIISYSLMILSVWVTILMFFSSSSIFFTKNYTTYFYMLLMALLLVLLMAFSCLNLISFYFFFEASLIPTLLIIMGWGYQPERLQAGIYLLFYTLTASLPLLVILVVCYYYSGGLDYFLFLNNSLSFLNSLILFFCLSMAFLAKMPMFFVHLWLPKAHVEAPVAGSMVLAGVLLKLGGYGFYRVLGLMKGGFGYGNYLFGLSLAGMIYVGFMCCRLNDLKALVAYSSVAHMAMVVCGIFSYFCWGMSGALMMMISHGLSSSGLFCMVNMYYYRSGSRSFYLNKGLLTILPLLTLFFFLLCAANMAAPPTVNLLSEIYLMASILKFDYLMLLIFPLGSYLGAVFTLFLFSYSQHGSVYLGGYSYFCVSFTEFHLMILHLLPLNFLVLKSEFFMFIY